MEKVSEYVQTLSYEAWAKYITKNVEYRTEFQSLQSFQQVVAKGA